HLGLCTVLCTPNPLLSCHLSFRRLCLHAHRFKRSVRPIFLFQKKRVPAKYVRTDIEVRHRIRPDYTHSAFQHPDRSGCSYGSVCQRLGTSNRTHLSIAALPDTETTAE